MNKGNGDGANWFASRVTFSVAGRTELASNSDSSCRVFASSHFAACIGYSF